MQLSLLLPQNTGQNQPSGTFEFWQDFDQKVAEQICRNDVDLFRERPAYHIRNPEVNVLNSVSPSIFFCRRNRDWVFIDRDHAFRSKPHGG